MKFIKKEKRNEGEFAIFENSEIRRVEYNIDVLKKEKAELEKRLDFINSILSKLNAA